MSEIMRPMPFARLMDWALSEYRAEGRIFGVQKDKFYTPAAGAGIEMFGAHIASPVGPAAGPDSQLAQNIVAAYLAGGRFIELKTVQKMDGAELRACVPRPCINAQDEGYNVEWSTELTVPEAFDEYVKAWVMVHVLAAELGLGPAAVAFNMSVGYDLEGIRLPKIDAFIEGMKDAASTPVWAGCTGWLRENMGRFRRFDAAALAALPTQVSNSVTLSTLHGCPPAEIERIATFLLSEKKVHTFVKCNPTLLGYETARRLLDEMGYGYVSFDEHHFQNDLQYPDAVAMLKRLMALGEEKSLAFGVKITNTFPVKIARGELPGEEMYMSGRSLLPLSLNVARKLAADFEGRLPISYSGGADAFNLADLLAVGIRPVTVATTILKPGGYLRLLQLAKQAEVAVDSPEWAGVDAAGLTTLCQSLPGAEVYRKAHRPVASRKTADPLRLFDCFVAPCREGGCPIEQQIPAYLKLVAEGKYDEAFRVIAVDNAAPSVTGTLCPHPCQDKCTRLDYEDPLQIRQAKLLASEAAQAAFTAAMAPAPLKTDKKAVVVGAGPAGIAAALFLRRAGVAVTVLEKRAKPFGVVEYAIPAFRIPAEAMARDYEMAVKAGVDFRFNAPVEDVAALRAGYDFVVLAVGAWKEGTPAVEEGAQHTLDALAFLEESKAKGCQVALGRRVAVIGGGDVAMDCARAAKRAPGVESVTLVYRRTRDFMPASPEEIELALADGVEMVELHAPKRCDANSLTCECMELGDWADDGRRGIVGTGVERTFAFDTVICAVGARVDDSLFRAAGLELDKRGRPVLDAFGESSAENLFVAGDCRAGPATVVQAIADAKRVARGILAKLGLPDGFARAGADAVPQPELYARKGELARAAAGNEDGARCLGCDSLCELCVDVCPNRANVRLLLPGMKNSAQILHVDALCNECGNCGVFCPHQGDPYRDKITVFAGVEDFEDSANKGFVRLPGGGWRLRLPGGRVKDARLEDAAMPAGYAAAIRKIEQDMPYLL